MFPEVRFKIFTIGMALFVGTSGLFALAQDSPSQPSSHITPYLGPASVKGCAPFSVNGGNAIGFLSLPLDEQTAKAVILYRGSKGRSEKIILRMMKEDAENLRMAVSELLKKDRIKPIRFDRSRLKTGECEVVGVHS